MPVTLLGNIQSNRAQSQYGLFLLLFYNYRIPLFYGVKKSSQHLVWDAHLRTPPNRKEDYLKMKMCCFVYNINIYINHENRGRITVFSNILKHIINSPPIFNLWTRLMWQYFINQQSSTFGHAPGTTTGAKATFFTAKRN